MTNTFNGESSGAIVYGHRKLTLKDAIITILLPVAAWWLIKLGRNHLAISHNGFSDYRAIKEIAIGSLFVLFFVFGNILTVFCRIKGRPNLRIFSDGLQYQDLWQIRTAMWSSLGPFEFSKLNNGKVTNTIISKKIGNSPANSRNIGDKLRISAGLLAVDSYDLLNQLNSHRAAALNYVYQAVLKPPKKSFISRLSNSQKWTLWWSGTIILFLIIVKIVEIVFSIPKLPFEYYGCLLALVFGICVATYKTRRSR